MLAAMLPGRLPHHDCWGPCMANPVWTGENKALAHGKLPLAPYLADSLSQLHAKICQHCQTQIEWTQIGVMLTDQ